jgi:hypothetical protein
MLVPIRFEKHEHGLIYSCSFCFSKPNQIWALEFAVSECLMAVGASCAGGATLFGFGMHTQHKHLRLAVDSSNIFSGGGPSSIIVAVGSETQHLAVRVTIGQEQNERSSRC